MTPVEDITTGGSEADHLEQQATVAPEGGDGEPGTTLFGSGNGGSEADVLEQAAALPEDSDSEYPRDSDDE
jgi:hypothetical protein